MIAVHTRELELAEIRTPGDDSRHVRAAFPVHWEAGSAATSMVYFELDPGMHLGTHRDTPEELLVVLEGEVEATVGEERVRLGPGSVAVVPSMAPHDVRNVGEGTARVCGVFPANTMVAHFAEPFSVMGAEPTRVNGTPLPEREG